MKTRLERMTAYVVIGLVTIAICFVAIAGVAIERYFEGQERAAFIPSAGHPSMRYGADCPLQYLSYTTHVTLYDKRLRLPVWVRGRIYPGVTSIERSDDYHQDHTLRDAESVKPELYQTWNREHPGRRYDIGHGLASRYRRDSQLSQFDVDVMTNTWPESPGMNRGEKAQIEKRILDLAADERTKSVTVWSGPGFDRGRPIEYLGKGGPAIPHFAWMVVMQERTRAIEFWAFVFPNDSDPKTEFTSISVDRLSQRLGYEIAQEVKSDKGKNAKARIAEHWWHD